MPLSAFPMFGSLRPATILSILMVFLYSHRTCQSFQQSPHSLLKTQTPAFSPTASPESFGNNRKYTAYRRFYADPKSSNIHDQTPPPPSFEERMRLQLKRHRSMPPSHPTKGHGVNQLVPDVRNLQEYKKALDKAGDENKMLAVLWYSPWCKACRAVMPGIRTLAKRHPDVQFIQVPVLAENASLHQGLDVPSVPYMHLYAQEDPRLVEEKKMTRKRLSGFQKLLNDYERGNCSLEQMGRGDENGDGVWSTSNPYLNPSENSKLTEDEGQNLPEAQTEGIGATIQ